MIASAGLPSALEVASQPGPAVGGRVLAGIELALEDHDPLAQRLRRLEGMDLASQDGLGLLGGLGLLVSGGQLDEGVPRPVEGNEEVGEPEPEVEIVRGELDGLGERIEGFLAIAEPGQDLAEPSLLGRRLAGAGHPGSHGVARPLELVVYSPRYSRYCAESGAIAMARL